MAKRKRGIVRREKIVIDGEEIEVDTFDARVVLGSGEELESIEELLTEEEVEKEIQATLKEIEILAQKYPNKERDIWYCYEVGKVLQFVDDKGFTDRKGLIWRRMAYDLRPDLFGGKIKIAEESRRYPQIMYYLGKQKKGNIKRATPDQWYEILKFRRIYKGEDNELLERILTECETKNLTRAKINQRIKELQQD
jgi:phosphopantetheinyl transferase (holo-ACP synthase)